MTQKTVNFGVIDIKGHPDLQIIINKIKIKSTQMLNATSAPATLVVSLLANSALALHLTNEAALTATTASVSDLEVYSGANCQGHSY